jgi:hypothetical protein
MSDIMSQVIKIKPAQVSRASLGYIGLRISLGAASGFRQSVDYVFFDPTFSTLIEFASRGLEDLNPVVLVGIVRSADYHSGISR